MFLKKPFHWKRFINLNELVYDIAMVLAISFLLNSILPDHRRLIEIFSPAAIFILSLAASFIIVFFTGTLYRDFEETLVDSSGKWKEVLLKIVFFLVITGLYLTVILFFSAHRVMPWPETYKRLDLFIMVVPIYPVFYGMLFSLPFDLFKELKGVLYLPALLGIVLIPVTAAEFGSFTRWFYGLLAFFVMVGLLALPLIFRFRQNRKQEKLLRRRFLELKSAGNEPRDIFRILESEKKELARRNPLFSLIRKLGSQFVFPVISAVFMVLWQKMLLEMLIQSRANWKLLPDRDLVLWSMFLSGLLPLRILSDIAPPYRPLNTVFAVGAVVYTLYTLYRLV